MPENQPTAPQPFHFGCETEVFPIEELAALSARGAMMEALACGAIAPTTPEQQHFLQVDRDEAEPATLDERAWLRLKGRREFEREQGRDKTPKEDYGIIEWDKEKCWW